ncbi:metal ABC transporter solute-binding protein, Zn/Mn family [Bifidobacterium oedipodis]|uniref:ABC transporter substrate-binding protein n=1 Tax=Bifidobacterium oedipodis TaxID=2675322 RepID=A0A7Y0ENJ4_9BIFI|nr:zinc ABC transporter substrate-binding protein [Bifidobacterium sp. DSM 109957]NMM93516.1 ABC transporter substrate-binding protein [Bifidobacterium sp. DSM 109957]
MGNRNRITRITRLFVAGASALLLLGATACGSVDAATNEPADKQPAPEPNGPISVVASINQWGALAAELGGDDVSVTSIVNSTNVDAHDFEPKTSDVAELSKAQIVVTNGAGYDSWATKSLGANTSIVSAASVVGAMDGDNPHLWFSKDARNGMAEEITGAYIKAMPSKKKAFEQRLKTWQAGEKSLEQWVSDFTESHAGTNYAATEPLAYYLMSDLGFNDKTPKGYAQALASGGEVAPADLQAFQKLIEGREVSLLVNNTQEASDTTNMITGTAGRSDVPVVDISEQMPENVSSLNEWINQLINSIIDAVDPTYGCQADPDASDTEAAEGNDEQGDASDDSAGSSDAGDTNDPDASDAADDKSDAEDDVKAEKAPTFGRVCSSTTSSSEGSSDSSTNDAGETGTDNSATSGNPEGVTSDTPPDPGK